MKQLLQRRLGCSFIDLPFAFVQLQLGIFVRAARPAVKDLNGQVRARFFWVLTWSRSPCPRVKEAYLLNPQSPGERYWE